MSENSSVWLMFVFVRNQCQIKLLVSCELLVETKYQYTLISYIHIVNIPTWSCLCRHGQWLASRRYRDTEGLIVQSSTASTLSALCSMCRMLAGLHTVVCVQTNLVGRGERRRLVEVLGGSLVAWGLVLCGSFESTGRCVTLGIIPLKPWQFCWYGYVE